MSFKSILSKGLHNLVSNSPPKTERLLSLFLVIVISLLSVSMLTVIKQGLKEDLTTYYQDTYEQKAKSLVKQIEHYIEVRHIQLETQTDSSIIKQSVMDPLNNLGQLRDFFFEQKIIGAQYPQVLLDFQGEVIFSSYAIHQNHRFLEAEYTANNKLSSKLQAVYEQKKEFDLQLSTRHQHILVSLPVKYGPNVEGILVTYIPINEIETKLDMNLLSNIQIKLSNLNGQYVEWGSKNAISETVIPSQFTDIEFSYSIDFTLLNNTFNNAVNRLIFSAILVAIISTGLAIILGRWFFVRPIEKLKDFAEELSKGADPHLEKTKRITVEIQQLSDQITEMAREIHKREQALIETNSALKRNQESLVHSEKMAGLGQVTAGIAHEINNPIGFIMNNLSMLEEYHLFLKKLIRQLMSLMNNLSADEKLNHQSILNDLAKTLKEEDLEFVINDLDCITSESIKGADRVKDIIIGLKGYAYSGEKMSLVDINECVESTLNMVWNELKYNCKVEKDLKPLTQLECIGGQINQVLMNLFINASHAMPKTGGELKIQTYQMKDEIRIIVSDNGSGIKEENLKHIFEPFFTTKPVGEGTGLGMSICYDIIKNHGGNIQVESEEGVGTSFMITLPISHSG